jgi:hypothetical protein
VPFRSASPPTQFKSGGHFEGMPFCASKVEFCKSPPLPVTASGPDSESSKEVNLQQVKQCPELSIEYLPGSTTEDPEVTANNLLNLLPNAPGEEKCPT